MMRRLPISLRFDDETDFYNDFIVEKRDSRELSTLILDLLTVYYEDETVRQLVNNYIDAQNPYLSISEQLQRIAFEHSRRKVSTNLLSDYTNNEGKKIFKTEEKVENTETSESDHNPQSEVLSLPVHGITAESLTPVITEVLKQLGIVGNLPNTFNGIPPEINKIVENAHESINHPSTITPMMATRPVIVQPSVEVHVAGEEVVVEPPMRVVEPSKSVVEVSTNVSQSVNDIETPKEVTEKKAPKSFKKLLKSV